MEEEWLNKPCPKCGDNLLTEEDYNTVKDLTSLVSMFSEMMDEVPEDVTIEDYTKTEFELDGSGNLRLKEE